VRTPGYDATTDDPAIRDPGFDSYHLSVEEDQSKTLDRIERDRIDLTNDDVDIDTVRRYVTHSRLRPNLHVETGDRLWYIAMNLTQRPFDDVHVRRAVNLVMDKDLLQRSWGGEVEGTVATHIVPDDLLDRPLADPYPSHRHTGDVDAARKEMALSRYDADGDGICDDPACAGVIHIARTDGQWEAIDEVVTESLAKIGIELDTRTPDDPYSYIADARSVMSITSLPSWVKDYPDPFGVLGFLLSSRNITVTDNYNYSLVGLTRSLADDLGIDYPKHPVPSIDPEIDACVVIQEIHDRRSCWADLDREVMTDIAPWVPYLSASRLVVTSDRVDYGFDTAMGDISFAHLGLRPGR
jgi:peptide/nickel transport system substrate-binding protein